MEQSSLPRKSSSFGARLERFCSRPSAVLTIEPVRETGTSSPPAARSEQIPAQTLAEECEGSLATEPLLGNPVQPAQQIVGPTGSNSHQPKDELDKKMDFAYNISLVVNVALFAAKIYAFAVSHSKSVLASCADSLVDIASQLVLALADYKVAKADPKFPVGRSRLEAVGVVSCAVLMSLSTIEVIQSSSMDLVSGLAYGKLPELDMGLMMYSILGAAVGLKILLYLYCVALKSRSDSMLALAEDHLNDIMSNITAIVCGAIASNYRKVWWLDPTGAVLISLYIIRSWVIICWQQVDKIVGRGAPREFVDNLMSIANSHHEHLSVDCIRAYHFGSRFIVELEVLLPPQMTVEESHDIALFLQHKVEAFDEVERAFVHVDYTKRFEPEHKVDYNLRHNHSDLFDNQEVVRSAASLSGHLSGKLSGSISGGENSGLSLKSGSPSTHSGQMHNSDTHEGSHHKGDNLV
ncbi:hypothetical protein WJX74_002590 [Apatococcus lobatus]|uniref:Cation efflux protein cytoplasmic domain-containing protein n=1 Tax=Apatococcus lobatus TaxID=904363 RepID=A0AAW1R4K1_9CHLO